MFVTTAGRTNQQLIEEAMKIAKDLEVEYLPRKKKSIASLQNEMDSDCIMVGKDSLELYGKGMEQPFFFHPNSAMFRIKRLLMGDHDPFADAAQLTKGMSLIDCTLGLASDSIVASFLVGEYGKITGIEGQKYLAYLVEKGLASWNRGLQEVTAAMRRIHVINLNASTYLRSLPSESVDCVYFDPMFEEKIVESDGIKALGNFAIDDQLEEDLLIEAIRVSKRRIIMKDHYKSTRFDKFGFKVVRRKSAKFHFGTIEKRN